MARLGLLDLLAPQFLAGVTFSGFPFADQLHEILSFIRVRDMTTTWDEFGTLYTGDARFSGEGTASPIPRLTAPSGTTMDLEDVNLGFRLTIPRTGSPFIKNAVDDLGLPGSPFEQTKQILDTFGSVPANGQPTDYPSLAFRLELLLTAVTLHLFPKNVFPARNAADGWLEVDPAFLDVKLVLPKVAMILTQGDTYGDLSFELAGWGVNSLDDPADLAAGEAVRMVPPLALHKSGAWGFGIEKAVVDFSRDFTPPDILSQFGAGDDFVGLWLPLVRVFISPQKASGLAFDTRAEHLLISFDGEISGEFDVEIMRRNAELTVKPLLFQANEPRQVTSGPRRVPQAGQVVVTGSQASVAADGELHLEITGGQPPYTIDVKLDGQQILATPFDGIAENINTPVWKLNRTQASPPGGSSTLIVDVRDSSPNPVSTYHEEIQLALLAPGTTFQSLSTNKPVQLEAVDEQTTPGFKLELIDPQPYPDFVLLKATSTPDAGPLATVMAGNTPVQFVDPLSIAVPFQPGGPEVTVTATWNPPAPGANGRFRQPFATNHPICRQRDGAGCKEQDKIAVAKNLIMIHAGEVERTEPTQGTLLDFLKRANGADINIRGRASVIAEDSTKSGIAAYNQVLSDNRAEAVRQAITSLDVRDTAGTGIPVHVGESFGSGTQDAQQAPKTNYHHEDFEDAILTFAPPARGASQATVRLTQPPPPPPKKEPPPAQQLPDSPVFRRVGFRVGLQRNELVLAEVHGELDFKTTAEAKAGQIRQAAAPSSPPATLVAQTSPSASANPDVNPADGVVDFRIAVVYDTATNLRTIEVVLGAGEADRNGLIDGKVGPELLNDIVGALLIFAPLLVDAVDAAIDAEGSGPPTEIELGPEQFLAAGAIAAPITLATTGALDTQRFLFFGIDVTVTQVLASDGILSGVDHFDEFTVLVDYGIDYAVHINLGPLKVNSKKDSQGNDLPLRVRYRGLGLKVKRQLDETSGQPRDVFKPVFDSSRGYELGLAEPGVLEIDEPLGDILKILGARVARVNPVTLDLDLGLNADIGVFSMDRIGMKVPLDPLGPPTITAAGISVDVPGALSGSGFLDLREGIKGSLDLTVVPLRLRIAAGLALQRIPPEQLPDDQADRRVTAALATLGVEFPTPVPLPAPGVGLYGLLGLFAMHYKRNEDPDAALPALDWLNRVAQGNPGNLAAWVAGVDRWSLGLGAVLGTIEGGFVINLKGMLMLELPGPRVLIFSKLQVLSKRPDTEGSVENVGTLATVDLDFGLRRLTVGAIRHANFDPLFSMTIPSEGEFLFDDPAKWHFYMGQIDAPASAEFLDVLKATGYLMFDGDRIDNFPAPDGTPITLPGLAIALGIRASLVLGDEDGGLFLRAAAALDAGLTFSPFHIYGYVDLRGELRLFIVSISASATLEVDAPDPTLIRGEACAKVDLLFFSLEGCVSFSIGDGSPQLDAPLLVRGLTLQSRSPALVQGQGTDAPIDGALAQATEVAAVDDEIDPDLAVVPIDAVPVLQLHAAPLLDADFHTFTLPLVQAPRLFPDGWLDQGGGRQVRYRLHDLRLDPPFAPNPPEGLPPATWRASDDAPRGVDSSVDLALFAWEPDPTPRAVQRSTELIDRVSKRWSGACDPAAPARPSLWTFHRQPLGPSAGGWHLTGAALPDPEPARRSAAPDTRLFVHPRPGPALAPLLAALLADSGAGQVEPARVIGEDPRLSSQVLASPVFDNDPVKLPGRVLQLPFAHPALGSGFNLPHDYAQRIDAEPQRVVFESGPVEYVRLLLAVNAPLLDLHGLRLRAFDADNALLEERPIDALDSPATTLAALPTTWTASASPWTPDVKQAFDFLQTRFPSLQRILVNWTPPERTVRFEVVALGVPPNATPPSLLVGAVELLRASERSREKHDAAGRESEIHTIEGALQASTPRPLLQPGTRYTVSLSYSTDVRQPRSDADGGGFDETLGPSQTQRFTFVTDAAPPVRLEPWVLATSPANRDTVHFVEEPVQIVFNDGAAIQLFEAYGASLRAVVRKANGKHPADQPPVTPDSLEPVDALVFTPFEDALRKTIADHRLECVQVPPSESHRVFTLPIELERGTSYEVEIVSDLPTPGAPDDPHSPLFQLAFTTSRFSSPAELATLVSKGFVAQKSMRTRGVFDSLAEAASDAQIQAALTAAGLDIPPSGRPSTTLLWQAVAPNSIDFELVALLIDSPEPLWRSRLEPELVTVSGPEGDMQHWVSTPHVSLELVELVDPPGSDSAVERFVRSPSGTRTLALLRPGASVLNVALRQHAIGLLDSANPTTDAVLLAGTLPTTPPWSSVDA